MQDHSTHEGHTHKHGAGCGHTAVRHEGHLDYLHEGHLHHVHGDHIDEHALSVGGANAGGCTPNHACGGHDKAHVHSEDCGHLGVPHGDHIDYLVNDHLHHQHGDHCDDHGAVELG